VPNLTQQTWDRSSPWAVALPPHRPTAPPERADVVVVGAGIAGLVTASVLSAQGAQVAVLDRHGVGGVVTRNSTAKLSALQGTIHRLLADAHGPDAAADYAAANLAAVEGLVGLIERCGIDCALRSAPALTYATTAEGAESAAAELAAAKAAGLPVTWVADAGLPFETTGAVRLDGQVHLDPGALCAGLAAALPPGSSVHTGVTVASLEEGDDSCVVRTATGEELSCDHVVLATHAPIDDPAQLSTRCTPHRSYGVAAPLQDPPEGLYLSVEEPTRSIRPAVIAGGPAVVVAGQGHLVGDLPDPEDPWEPLARFARKQLGAGPVTHRWATHDLVPSDHLPFIGPLAPGASRRWVATGFQKWGISAAWIAADLISAAIRGEDRPWTPLFDPTRVASTLNAELARAGLRSARNLGARVVSRSTTSTGRRTVCTHLGCELRANEQEGTWDCPCHGSRFGDDGRAICGPAVVDLPGSG
jgi:glycine/D-amino acid oxidase-like deaminating enzyme/nitrite reductase/ring-hydroxylating ferredoxin subunit